MVRRAGAALAAPRLQIIDFEYGAFNHRGFDLANHFCEHCGFDFDLARHPSPAAQEAFLREYCAEARLEPPAGVAPAAFLGALQRRVARFALASDLWWGLWALVQARVSPLDFDFAGYGARRLAAYNIHKAALFPRAPLHAA